MRPRRIGLAVAPAVVAFLLSAGALEAALQVRIVEPAAGQALFGAIEVVVEVAGDMPESVALYYDDAKVASLRSPPYRFAIDVGEENVERAIRIVAQLRTGERVEATLRSPKLQIDEVLDLPLRQVYVTATRGGGPALDLIRSSFRIADNAERQSLVTFERGDVPLAAVLLVDSSLSMEGEPMRAALAGAHAFADRLARLDEVMLLQFSDRVEHATTFTNDAVALVSGAVSARPEGGSAINDHLYLALELLERRQGRRVAILLSDGVDIESFLSARQVAEMAARCQTMIYWIRVGAEPIETRYRSPWREPEEHAAEIAALDELVRASGGRRIDIPDVASASGAFEEVVAEIRGQYVLGYYPMQVDGGGSWHRIEVEATDRRVRLRTRDGYFDD